MALVAIAVRLFDGTVQLAELVETRRALRPLSPFCWKVLFDPILRADQDSSYQEGRLFSRRCARHRAADDRA